MIVLWAAAAAHAELSLTVDEAVAMAIERNPNLDREELAVLVAQIREARARLDRFTAQVSGGASAELGVTKPWGAPAVDASDAGWSATATAGVPLYAGGRVQALIDTARLGADIADVELTVTRRELARAAYTAYWNLKGIELQISAQEEGLDATRQALDIIRSKADNGLAAGIDVNRSTVDLLSQEESLVAQRAARVEARQQLVRILAIDDTEIVLASEPPHPLEGTVTVPADLLAGRPEIARQSLTVDQADAGVRLARSAALPSVTVTGTATAVALTADPVAAADLGHPTLDAAVGVALAWNPFDLLRVRQDVQQAQAERQQVEAQNAAERNGITAEVRAAAARLDGLRARFPLIDRQVALARDNQGIVRDLYAQGSATILDLFNAQSAFRAAAIQEASLLVDLATAELDYRWLLGEEPAGNNVPSGETP